MPPVSDAARSSTPVQVQCYPEHSEPNRDDLGRHAKKEPRSPARGSSVGAGVSSEASGPVCLLDCGDLVSELVELRGGH